MRILPFSNNTLSAVLLIILFVFICVCSCGKNSVTDSANGVTVSELIGKEYGVAVLDQDESLTLFGLILFDDIQGETISGRWCMETWGEQEDFPTLKVNSGEAFPDKTNLRNYTGQIFSDMVIIKLQFPDSESTLGVVFDEQHGEELFGTAALLPGKAFEGSIKAILSSHTDN